MNATSKTTFEYWYIINNSLTEQQNSSNLWIHSYTKRYISAVRSTVLTSSIYVATVAVSNRSHYAIVKVMSVVPVCNNGWWHAQADWNHACTSSSRPPLCSESSPQVECYYTIFSSSWYDFVLKWSTELKQIRKHSFAEYLWALLVVCRQALALQVKW